MSTRIGVVNDANHMLAENITLREAIIRTLVAAALLSVLFVEPYIQAKIILVISAVYLFTTAIMQWDPVYAVLKSLTDNSTAREPGHLMTDIIMENIASRDDPHAANDTIRSESKRKKTGYC